MPNPTDQDRLSDTTRGGVIVDLSAYRAEAAAANAMKTSSPLAVGMRCPMCAAVTIFFALALLAYLVRR